jgi:hypothetical protein
MAQRQQAGLRPIRGRTIIERGVSHGSKQHGIGGETSLACFIGQRRKPSAKGRAADRVRIECQTQVKALADFLKDTNRCRRNFWSNPVTGKEGNPAGPRHQTP